MKIVEQYLEIPDFAINTHPTETVSHTDPLSYTSDEKCLYFDIETTGLNAKRSHLYLMGAMWRENNNYVLRQWFAERPADEETVINAFIQLAAGFTKLIHFNGATFDLPYICNKALFYGLDPEEVKAMPSIDLYQLYRSLKSILCADDMKLAGLQKLCGYDRKDHHSGKDLIKVYETYLQTADPLALDKLLQHNMDDIIGMLWIKRLDTIMELKQELLIPDTITASVTTQTAPAEYDLQELVLQCTFSAQFVELPQPLTCAGITLTFNDNTCRLQSPIINGTYCYYYPDYKNYYYLPEEDRAIHKSIGAYVDASARKKATADTCYEKKHGSFLREFKAALTPALQDHPKNPDEFFLPFNEDLLQDKQSLIAYFIHIAGYILKHR